jgi:hypothetical protein
VDNTVEDIKLYQKKLKTTWNEWTEAAYRGWLSSIILGNGAIWEDRDDDGETKNTLSFKGTGLKT